MLDYNLDRFQESWVFEIWFIIVKKLFDIEKMLFALFFTMFKIMAAMTQTAFFKMQ